ncbi:MAG: DUF2807 domain-containing protein [Hyphomonadaceae bacterium]|nr:DUF2807 domain-containing protein [Hyphomonadaceae bacterium]
MMRSIVLGVALAGAALPAVAETRALTGFDTVNASGNYRVEVAVGERFSVEVTGSDAARIRTVVDGDTLKIEPARRAWFGNPRYDALVRVTAPQLAGVAASRGMSMTAAGGGACPSFDAVAAMGAELSVTDLQCGAVDAVAAMGAALTLAGSCEALDVSAAMGATVRARNLHCENADLSAAMGADVAAYATARYEASASMGGDISVAGGAQSDGNTAAMGGSIRQLN